MKLKHRGKRKITASLDMTPLIDVVFQLLIFFMLSATFVVQSSVPIELPEKNADSPTPVEAKDIVVSVTADGQFYIGDNADAPIASDALGASLKEAAASRPMSDPALKPMVLIRADGTVPTQTLIDVMEACEEADLRNFGIGVRAQSE